MRLGTKAGRHVIILGIRSSQLLAPNWRKGVTPKGEAHQRSYDIGAMKIIQRIKLQYEK